MPKIHLYHEYKPNLKDAYQTCMYMACQQEVNPQVAQKKSDDMESYEKTTLLLT